ncbi:MULTISPECIES: hypothetical protein [Pseudomonas]|nr:MULTISPECIES: hypothetical protein [Pseudomonas]
MSRSNEKGGLAHLVHLEGIPFLIPLDKVDALLALNRPEQRVDWR